MNTTISISKNTRMILQEFGKKSETYDDIIKRMFSELKFQAMLRDFINDSEYSTLEEAEEWTKLKLKK